MLSTMSVTLHSSRQPAYLPYIRWILWREITDFFLCYGTGGSHSGHFRTSGNETGSMCLNSWQSPQITATPSTLILLLTKWYLIRIPAHRFCQIQLNGTSELGFYHSLSRESVLKSVRDVARYMMSKTRSKSYLPHYTFWSYVALFNSTCKDGPHILLKRSGIYLCFCNAFHWKVAVITTRSWILPVGLKSQICPISGAIADWPMHSPPFQTTWQPYFFPFIGIAWLRGRFFRFIPPSSLRNGRNAGLLFLFPGCWYDSTTWSTI